MRNAKRNKAFTRAFSLADPVTQGITVIHGVNKSPGLASSSGTPSRSTAALPDSPGARGEGGPRTGSAPGAGRSRAARVGNRVVAGMGGGPSCAPGIPTAAGLFRSDWFYHTNMLSKPSVITKAICRAVNSRHPKVSYCCGRFAWSGRLAHALLPARWWDAIMRRLAKIKMK